MYAPYYKTLFPTPAPPKRCIYSTTSLYDLKSEQHIFEKAGL